MNDGPTLYDSFKDYLYKIERAAGKSLGIDEIISYASGRPNELGYSTDDDSGVGKTVRHLLLAGELQRRHPNLAGPILNGHEYVINVLQNQPTDTRNRDLYNNNLGRQLGAQAKSREDLERLVYEALSRAQNTNTPISKQQLEQGFAGTPPPKGSPASQMQEGFRGTRTP